MLVGTAAVATQFDVYFVGGMAKVAAELVRSSFVLKGPALLRCGGGRGVCKASLMTRT
jgi:hypothetical protein